MIEKHCPKCNATHSLSGTFCSRACANSRTWSAEDKKKKSIAATGKKQTKDSIRKQILSKGQTLKENTICVICGDSTKTKNRKTCSERCKSDLVSYQSRMHPLCGGQRQTKRSRITNIEGEIFVSESSFETRLAEIFNELEILWVRPKHLFYTDIKGNKRRYHPDFYLPNHDLYFDPKNDYLIKTDIDKINRTSKENDIKIIILGEKYINKDDVKGLVGDRGNAPLLPACKAGTLLLS